MIDRSLSKQEESELRRRAPFPCSYCGRSYMLPIPRACCSRGREWDIKIIAAQGTRMNGEAHPTSNEPTLLQKLRSPLAAFERSDAVSLVRAQGLCDQAAREIEQLRHERDERAEWAAAWHKALETVATILEVPSAGSDKMLLQDIANAIEELRGSVHETSTELHKSHPALHVALCDLSQAIGNPALEVSADSSFEVELIKEATRRFTYDEDDIDPLGDGVPIDKRTHQSAQETKPDGEDSYIHGPGTFPHSDGCRCARCSPPETPARCTCGSTTGQHAFNCQFRRDGDDGKGSVNGRADE